MRCRIAALTAALLVSALTTTPALADDAAATEAEQPAAVQLQSELAQAAVKKYRQANEAIEKNYQEARQQNRLALIAALRAALQTEGIDSDEQEKNRIGEAIRRLEGTTKTLIQDGIYLAAEFDSIWTHEYHVDGDDIRLTRVIHDDGAKHKVGWVGKIKPLGLNTVQIHWTLPNGKKTRDVWAIADARIFHQHWPEGSDLSQPAPHHLISDVKKEVE